MATGTGARQTAPAFQESFSLRGAPVSDGAIRGRPAQRKLREIDTGRDRLRRKGLGCTKGTKRRGECRRKPRLQQMAPVEARSAALVVVAHQSPLLRWHSSAIRATFRVAHVPCGAALRE